MKQTISILILLYLIAYTNIIGQQIYFHKTYYENIYDGFAMDIMRIDSSHYLISGRYTDEVNHIDAEFINKLDEYGNSIDTLTLEHKKDSLGNIFKYYYHHQFAEGLNGEYFTFLSVEVDSGGFKIATKFDINDDTIFSIELHSRIKPVDSLWSGSRYSFIMFEAICTPDGGVVMVGNTNGLYSDNAFVIKIDSVGSIEWEHRITNENAENYPFYSPTSVTILPDTSYVVAYYSIDGYVTWRNRIVLHKLNKDGVLINTKTIGGATEKRSPIIRYNSFDNKLYLAYSNEYFGNDNITPSVNYLKPNLMKMDLDFSFIFNKGYGKTEYYNNGFKRYPKYGLHDFIIDDNGKMTMFGYVFDNTSLYEQTSLKYLLRLNLNGDSLWFKAYDFEDLSTPGLWSKYPYGAIVKNNDKGYTMITNLQNDSMQIPLVFRVDSMGCPNLSCSYATIFEVNQHKIDLKIYPNPANNQITFELSKSFSKPLQIEFYNIFGIKVNELKF